MPALDYSQPITAESEYNRALLHPRVRAILALHGVLPHNEEERYAMATCPLGLAIATAPRLLGDEEAQQRILDEIARLRVSEPIEHRRADPLPAVPARIDDPGDESPPRWTTAVARYGCFELALSGPADGNPYLEVNLSARIDGPSGTAVVEGFHDGNGAYRIRFMPPEEGTYSFTTRSNATALDAVSGRFDVGAARPGSHGPVRTDGFHFRYADGTIYRPIGTTAYGWLHQPASSRDETVATLAESGFTKLRMALPPKWFAFNETEPELLPFHRTEDGRVDFDRPDHAFWRETEDRIAQLGELGVEADIILFHPYDNWGFEDMGPAADDRYVRYAVARLGAFPNVWWSLANEYDVIVMKSADDWERLGQLLRAADPAAHLRSIHHCIEPFDHRRPWIDHVSIQSMDVEQVTTWRAHPPAGLAGCAPS